ncbi:MAG: glycosyltransferase family 9 protein [Thermomicrobiales bacterium]
MSGWLAAKRLLAIRLDNAGDLVMLGPALRAIKETSPGVHLTLLATSAGAAVAPLLPAVDDVMVWRPVWQDLGRSSADPARDRELIDSIAERGFDGAIVFTSFRQNPHVPGYVCYLAGVPLRAGESKEFGGATLTDEFASGGDDLHQAERNLRLVERLGFATADRALRLSVPDDARDAAAWHLRRVGIARDAPFALLHPGASASARRYPADRFARVAALLTAQGLPVLATGSAREAADLATVSGGGSVPALAGETTLPELAALVEMAAVVVCGNTLPLHLADAAGTPVACLFSGTDLESQWRPRHAPHRLLRVETPCHPCYLIDCPIGKPCLDVEPETVAGEVFDLLGAERSTATVGAMAREAAS